ncbi:MAG: hypothetical protein WAQ99_07615 [Pyrinomonadaceae bacterium]
MIDTEKADEARKDLVDFLREVLDFLRSTLNEPYGDEGLLVLEEMVPELKQAWSGFIEDFDFQKTEQQILATSNEQLEGYGLYGAQLSAKLTLFRLRLSRFFGKKLKKTLGKLIPSIDTLLDSLIGATGIPDAIKELKDLLGNSIDD